MKDFEKELVFRNSHIQDMQKQLTKAIDKKEAYNETMKQLLKNMMLNKIDIENFRLKLNNGDHNFLLASILIQQILKENGVEIESDNYYSFEYKGFNMRQVKIIIKSKKDLYVYLEEDQDTGEVTIFTNLGIEEGPFKFKKIIVI